MDCSYLFPSCPTLTMSDVSMDIDVVSAIQPATINTIPFELLSSIFLFARHASAPGLYELHSRSPTQRVPFTLSHVSSYFRAVAFSLPELWDGILVNPGMLSPLRDPASLLIHSLNMASAGGRRGFRFSWRVSVVKSNPLHMTVLQTLFSLLLSHAHLWQSAELEVPVEVAPLLSQLRGHLPKLEELSVACYNTAVRSIEGFEDAPCLTHVGVLSMGGGTRFVFPHDGVRWFVDRRFNTVAESSDEVRDMMNLERLESAAFSTVPGEDILLPKVESMVVCDTAFRGDVHTPCLHELTIRPNRMGESELSGVLRAVEGSGCSLTALNVTPDFFLLPILDLSSSLEELSITFSSWQHDQAHIVKSLFVRMSQEPMFLPHLARLNINRCDRPYVSGEEPPCPLGDDLIAMLSQRLHTITAVAIDIWGTVRRDCVAELQLEKLRLIKSRGLDLCLRGNDFSSSRRFV